MKISRILRTAYLDCWLTSPPANSFHVDFNLSQQTFQEYLLKSPLHPQAGSSGYSTHALTQKTNTSIETSSYGENEMPISEEAQGVY